MAVVVLKASTSKKKAFLIWDFRNISNQFKCDLNVIVLPSVGVVLVEGLKRHFWMKGIMMVLGSASGAGEACARVETKRRR